MDADVIVLSDDETVVRAISPPLEMPDIEVLREVTHSYNRNGRSSSTSSEEGREIESILRDPISPLSESEMHKFDRGKSSSEHYNLPSTSGSSYWGVTAIRTSFSQPAASTARGSDNALSCHSVNEASCSHHLSEDDLQAVTFPSLAHNPSDDLVLARKKRKRTREEMEKDREVKEAERQRKNDEKRRKEVLKQEAREKMAEEKVQKKKEAMLAKEISKFQRELSSSKKSKCEQNLFCFVDVDLFSSFGGLEETLRHVFSDRNIGEQLMLEPSSGMKVCWKRRSLEADVCDGKLVRAEQLVYERTCVYFLTAETFKELCKTKRFHDFVQTTSRTVSFASPRVTVVIHGVRPDARVTNLVLEAYEQDQTQIRFVNSIYEMANLIARMHRSIAKLEKHIEGGTKLIFETEKGAKEGPNLVTDWWSKMLKHLQRLGSEQRQAIIRNFPDPFVLVQRLQGMDAVDALKLLADMTTEEGRRIGPVLAQKLYFMLTSHDGTELIDE